MNIADALKTGKPVSHPEMFGAFILIDENIYHTDYPGMDSNEWIKNNLTPQSLKWVAWSEILRDDWMVYDEASQ